MRDRIEHVGIRDAQLCSRQLCRRRSVPQAGELLSLDLSPVGGESKLLGVRELFGDVVEESGEQDALAVFVRPSERGCQTMRRLCHRQTVAPALRRERRRKVAWELSAQPLGAGGAGLLGGARRRAL